MSETTGILIDGISKIGAAENGDFIRMTFTVNDGGDHTIFLPIALFQGVMASLFAAGSIAYREKLRQFGSEENLLNALGVTPFVPTDFEPARGKDHGTGADVVLLRLKKDRIPMVDLVFDFQGAREVGEALIEEADKGPLPPDRPQ